MPPFRHSHVTHRRRGFRSRVAAKTTTYLWLFTPNKSLQILWQGPRGEEELGSKQGGQTASIWPGVRCFAFYLTDSFTLHKRIVFSFSWHKSVSHDFLKEMVKFFTQVVQTRFLRPWLPVPIALCTKINWQVSQISLPRLQPDNCLYIDFARDLDNARRENFFLDFLRFTISVHSS